MTSSESIESRLGDRRKPKLNEGRVSNAQDDTMIKSKFFEAAREALNNWDFDSDPSGPTVKAGLEKILADRIDLSANVADPDPRGGQYSDRMWEDINFQARYIMGEA